jgi:tRNA(adenine34) deaminase
MSNSDRHFMDRCYGLAESAKAAGESPVGTVIVRDGEVIAEGIEAVHAGPDPSGHAEMLAIRSACQRLGSADLSDCVLYTNVEPCFMCGYAIRATGIGRVVMAGPAGEIGAVDSNYAFLTDGSFERWGPPPEVVWLK